MGLAEATLEAYAMFYKTSTLVREICQEDFGFLIVGFDVCNFPATRSNRRSFGALAQSARLLRMTEADGARKPKSKRRSFDALAQSARLLRMTESGVGLSFRNLCQERRKDAADARAT